MIKQRQSNPTRHCRVGANQALPASLQRNKTEMSATSSSSSKHKFVRAAQMVRAVSRMFNTGCQSSLSVANTAILPDSARSLASEAPDPRTLRFIYSKAVSNAIEEYSLYLAKRAIANSVAVKPTVQRTTQATPKAAHRTPAHLDPLKTNPVVATPLNKSSCPPIPLRTGNQMRPTLSSKPPLAASHLQPSYPGSHRVREAPHSDPLHASFLATFPTQAPQQGHDCRQDRTSHQSLHESSYSKRPIVRPSELPDLKLPPFRERGAVGAQPFVTSKLSDIPVESRRQSQYHFAASHIFIDHLPEIYDSMVFMGQGQSHRRRMRQRNARHTRRRKQSQYAHQSTNATEATPPNQPTPATGLRHQMTMLPSIHKKHS